MWSQNLTVAYVSKPSKTSHVAIFECLFLELVLLRLIINIHHNLNSCTNLQSTDGLASVGPILGRDPSQVKVIQAIISIKSRVSFASLLNYASIVKEISRFIYNLLISIISR